MTKPIYRLRRFRTETRGAAAVEFGLMFPIFLVMFVGLLEFGYYINQIDMLEKSLRAGAMYAARNNAKPTAASDLNETAIENIVMTGDPGNSSDFVLKGWNGCSNCLTIAVFTRNGSEGSETTTTTIIDLRAAIPYDPVLPGGLWFLEGVSDLNLKANHEQAWIGS